jgi:hypothetical protein
MTMAGRRPAHTYPTGFNEELKRRVADLNPFGSEGRSSVSRSIYPPKRGVPVRLVTDLEVLGSFAAILLAIGAYLFSKIEA